MAKAKTIEERNKELAPKGLKLKLYGLKLLIEPSEEKKVQINKTIGCARFMYNYYLNERQMLYKTKKQSLSYFGFKESLKNVKADPTYTWLKLVDKFALENAIMDVDTAYKNFFEGRTKYPKFKNKHRAKQNYTTNMTNNNIKLDLTNNTVQLPKLGKVPFHMNKKLQANLMKNGLNGVIKSATVSRDASSKYYVALKLEEVVPLQTKPNLSTISTNDIVGIDLGLTHFAILSDGTKIENPKFYQSKLKKLASMQHRFSKMIPGGQNYSKQRKKIAKLHEHIKNMRHDFLHKISRKLVNENQVIVLEDLNVKGMIRNKKLAKSIQDVGWGYFKIFVSYKAEWANKYVIFIDRFFPSSKLCGGCGEKNTLLSLSERKWVCPICGTTHDRDINAAENIKKEGLNLLGI